MSDDYKRTDLEYIQKIYRYMKNDMPIETFMAKFKCNYNELNGLLELCRIYNKDIEIVMKDNVAVFKKNPPRVITNNSNKYNLDDLDHTEICYVSDTHFGNIHQQLHLLNEIYEEAYNRGIDTVYHVGDVTDGNYLNRPEQPRQQFLHGFDEQVSYVVDMYPSVNGITTKYILGSHDETHYKNGGATVNEWLSRCRKDMIFLGQDYALTEINGIKLLLDHPGGGSAQALSYKPQKRIEILESGEKPKMMAIGHYHKYYSYIDRNVWTTEVPALCDKTQFQQKQGLQNVVGGCFVEIYSDNKGHIQYFGSDAMLFDSKDMWDEVGKDSKKVRQLVIK